jgi:RNA polymerase sigma-70 factor (ECF subfamily)
VATAPRRSPFPDTRWTLVLKVRDLTNEPAAQQALARLCSDYWYPLYAFARRYGRSEHDAQDLTQAFFVYLVERNLFAAADPQAGRLRTFLLTTFQRFLASAHEHGQARKRGGDRQFVSLDADEGEILYQRELADDTTPEKIFERNWATATLRAALSVLADGEIKAGRTAQFQALEPFLSLEGAGENYAAAAAVLGTTEVGARQTASRLRLKLRTLVRRQIADTLRTPTESQIDEEMASLRAALRG